MAKKTRLQAVQNTDQYSGAIKRP